MLFEIRDFFFVYYISDLYFDPLYLSFWGHLLKIEILGFTLLNENLNF